MNHPDRRAAKPSKPNSLHLDHHDAEFRIREMTGANDLWLHCDGKRPVVLHYHIYKNAGSTIDAVLEREFGVFFSTLHQSDPNVMISNGELLSFVAQDKTLLALSSHQIRYPKPVSDEVEFFDFCFIRHPLDRLFSQYSFLRKPRVDDPLTEVAKAMDLAGFFSFLLDHHPEYACNPQMGLLLHQGHSRMIGPDHFEAVRVLLRDISLLGVVDAFDESIMIAEYALHPYFPRLRLHYCPQNVIDSQQMTLDQRLEVIRSRCGEQLYARLMEANQFDLALWREALLNLRCRVRDRPEHEHWLEEFRNRTERYQGGPRLRDRLLQRMNIRVQRTPYIQQNRIAAGGNYAARTEKLTPEPRTDIAKKAAEARSAKASKRPPAAVGE